MERLTIRGNKENVLLKGNGCTYAWQSYDCEVDEGRDKLKAALEKLAMYEDLEEKGLLNQLTTIKNYDPNIYRGVHTIRITIQMWDYVGHIIKKIYGNCKGKSILDFDFDEEDADIENDCSLYFDEEEEYFFAILKKENGDILEVEGDAHDFNRMIVATEIIDYEEEKEN